MRTQKDFQHIVFLSDYVPRRCGIATYTYNLYSALSQQYEEYEYEIVSVTDRKEGYEYPPEVRFEIIEQDLESYQKAVDYLNFNNVHLVSLQHEFGIFGGVGGSHILALVRQLHFPVVTTFHTILENPNPIQEKVMKELIAFSTRCICMCEKGKHFLIDIYNASEEKIDVIPHGVPEMPFVDPNFYKDQFGVEGKYVLLTFGLLSPQKGIEYVLKALPKIIAEIPNVVYIVLGATHPNIVRQHGESYRLSLERLANDLGIQNHVIFYNRFVEEDELKEFLGAADIYITPYLNKTQITSGTLSYAFGCGKAVISTPYWHAEELLAEDRGILVPFGDSEAIAKEVIGLLKDEPKRHAMRKKAYMLGREMMWSNVAHQYMRVFQKARKERPVWISRSYTVKTLNEEKRHLPEIRLDALFRLIGSPGIIQHAIFSIPRYESGYCTDDNARALLLTILLNEIGIESAELESAMRKFAAFLSYAFNEKKGRFRNFMDFNLQWTEEIGSEDCHGRSIWALGTCVAHAKYKDLQAWAVQLFERALASLPEFTSPRAWAFALLGLHEYLTILSGDRRAIQLCELFTDRLIQLYEHCASDDWQWFEDVIAYDDAKLSHALILSGIRRKNEKALQIGLRSLEWLIEIQKSPSGHFRPIGSNGGYHRRGTKSYFDQQPVSVHAILSACLQAFRATGEKIWWDRARLVFEWFLGRNDLGLSLYDPSTGGCFDALQLDRVNQNQGAESTLSWLLSLTEMHAMTQSLHVFSHPKI